MSKESLRCYTCSTHIGYVYSSMPVHPINCISCGDVDDSNEPEDGPCQECGERGCNGECFGDDMMGDN